MESIRLTRRRVFLLAPAAATIGVGHLSRWEAAAQNGTARAELLVRGEATLPAGEMAWRVVRDVAEVAPAANFERRALGFAVASAPFSALLLTDEATGSACRLAPGEAAFVREGTFQRRESLGEGAQGYLRIGLVAASAANDAGGDCLAFAGPLFAPSSEAVTLALLRVELAAGDTFALPPGAGASLVLVEQGEVELEVGEAAPREVLRTTVGSDTSYAVRSVASSAMLYGTRDATSVLVAAFA